MTARGITNEVYYAAGKVTRFLGSNNVDNAARVCHAPSTAALTSMVGAGATTISYTDLMASDLIVLFGSDVANAQPVVMKYLYLARKEGTRVAVVNPFREPGLERYWVPSNADSARRAEAAAGSSSSSTPCNASRNTSSGVPTAANI